MASMMLSMLLSGVRVSKIFQMRYGQMAVTNDIEIRSLQYDSRKVGRGDMFVALRGSSIDGNAFTADAVDRGALAVVTDVDAAMSDAYFMHAGVVKVVVPDARGALADLSSAYYGNPSRKLRMVGVTGTNGKTTTTHIIRALLEARGVRTGLLGTIAYQFGGTSVPAAHTTPESLELNELLARMVAEGCSSAVMEVSSHSLHQQRVRGIEFAAAVFTNLTQDHLDYHGTMEEYFRAKKILFDSLTPNGLAVINVDDDWGKKLAQAVRTKKITYGTSPAADVIAADVSLSPRGLSFKVLHDGAASEVASELVGRFNVSNLLASFAAGLALGIPKETMCEAMRRFQAVPGRFERFSSPRGWTAVVDYAHTPDALEKALTAVRDILRSSGSGKVITVFGCGGNRDRTKRPQMGKISAGMSDITVVTSDNPRHEDPEAIIDEIMAGVKGGSAVRREPDRAKAIRSALGEAAPGDIVLVAGKGHEEYQVIGDEKAHFSDREVVEEYIRTHA